MKVKFLKNHLNNKKGDNVELEYTRARYFINTGVAKLAEGDEGSSPVLKITKKKAAKRVAKIEKEIEGESLKVDLENK